MMAIVGSLVISLPINAYDVDRYASTSRLASGKWAKIRVSKAGMQYISDSQLKALGFSDPTKVNVYGFGGRQISENLNGDMPDDLPLLPSKRVANGIIFFGVDHILWSVSLNRTCNYTHTMQPYAEESYYFLSDVDVEGNEIGSIDLRDTESLDVADSFVERLVHEKDIFAPSVTGRNLLGEDLRSGQTTLKFSLPDNIGGDASMYICVAGKTTGSNGTVRLSSNGKLSSNSFNISAVTTAEQFMRRISSSVTVENCGNELQLGISFSSSGVISLARLDYVEIEYERALSLPSDQLYFYFNESSPIAASLKGATTETEIWDVTTAHAPKKVSFLLAGGTAHFRVEPGVREYVAFNPSKVNRPVEQAGIVANQDIHSMAVPDMLIITPSEYLSSARKVAAMHEEKDAMTVHVLTPEALYNEFSSGTPDISAFRKAMKMWYDRGLTESGDGSSKMRYCLIFSRPTYDNKMVTATVKGAGYPRVPIWQSPTGETDNSSYSTDDFIGMLEDYTPGWTIGSAKINVAVGRFPVRSVQEAETAVEKLLTYVNTPETGAWRNNVMLLADDQDSAQHLEQTERMYANMYAKGKGGSYQYERLYLDNFEQQLTSVGMQYPAAKARLLSKLEEGQALWTYVGHANTVSWTHEHLLEWGDITTLSNTRLPILYAATCEYARWDADDYSGGEYWWAMPKSGVIAMICPSRAVYISMNGPLSAQFGNFALTRNADGSPTRLGDSYRNMKNAISGNEDNKLRYGLLGDPAMKMPVYSYDVSTTEIHGVDITDNEADLPVIEARSNPVIKGIITDYKGEKASDFNGHIYLKIYDAEKVVETLGNGENGKVVAYNDRKTKLFDGATKVTDGEWEITAYMPSEITNNFTTGRITYYAISDDGREANGATDRFYVYGYNPDASEDITGPEIRRFTLNHDDFKNGDLTYKSPVVYATFSDESGINISDAGIGHSLMLTLDGKTVYDDVLNFYSPDLDDSRMGSITYQLPEIAPGKHELTLSVWDCANNSTYATLNFNVAAVKDPDIYEIGTRYDEAGVEFIISSDRPLASLGCMLEVFDFSGTRVWHHTTDGRTGSDSTISMRWDYSSAAGHRVDKGIYICRATVTSPEGRVAYKSKKIIVTK